MKAIRQVNEAVRSLLVTYWPLLLVVGVVAMALWVTADVWWSETSPPPSGSRIE